ncbi:MAG: AAA family ATPase [Chloroflexi bacterium]|nr:AAA family ATPase [Chloroflexota bacterium]
MGERAGLSGRGIQDLERGKRRRPQPSTARRLADALGLEDPLRGELLCAAFAQTPAALEGGLSAPAPLSALWLTGFVGREHEQTALRDQLEVTRLLTLVGPGGVGKTRLAAEVAAGIGYRYADGVRLIELSSLTRPELVVQVMAQALGLRVEVDSQAEDALTSYLARRQLLLVVDNCEHLIDACAEVVLSLLQRCPDIHVLATSREPLGVEGCNRKLWTGLRVTSAAYPPGC